MSEIRLVIREADCDWSGIVPASTADRAIAALSADPVTLRDLTAAVARYQRPTPDCACFVNLSRRLCDEPYDAGLIVIDFVARLVVVDSTYSSPGPSGAVDYHDGRCATEIALPYHLAEDWLFTHESLGWRAVAEQRRRERAARPALDARGVFYGRPLLEFIAREAFAAHARGAMTTVAAEDTIRQIHAAWMLTARDDLGGVSPRDVALAQRAHISWDLQDQAEHWSRLGECPPGVDESSRAFQNGGFGTHELVKYYDLVRELLWSCREQLAEGGESQPDHRSPEAFLASDFLTSEVPRLEAFRDEWLQTPDPECHGRTPRSIIDRERARLPEGVSGHDAIIDPDCPCCQMLADLPGPVFWHLDGCNMDDDFAFDIYRRTLEEWEQEQRDWQEFSRRFDEQWAERKRLGVTESGSPESGATSVWSASFCVGDSADVPLGVRLFGIGVRLAELIVDIRGEAAGGSAAPEIQPMIDRLNRDFGNLREMLQSTESSLAATLLDPVISRFSDTLADVSSARPDLAAKCESLTSSLARFLEPEASEFKEDGDDSELPF